VVGWGEKHSVLVAVDLGTGEPVALGDNVEESNLPALEGFLADLKQRLGVSVIVTDDLHTSRLAPARAFRSVWGSVGPQISAGPGLALE